MQLLFDFLPILLFFVAYKLEGIYVATGVLIVAVLAQTLVSWIRHRKVSAMLLTSAVLVLVFGGLTLLVHDAVFMKGPTIVQRLMGEKMVLEAPLWTRLNMMWVAFFVVVGALNLYVAFNFSESTWVNFKLFGLMGLTLVFALAQGLWLARKSEQVAADATPRAE